MTPLPQDCSKCPFAEHIDGTRYNCTQKIGLATVVRGHWQPTTDCTEHFEDVEPVAEVVETPREKNERLDRELKLAAKEVGVTATVTDWVCYSVKVMDGNDYLGRITASYGGWRIEVNLPQKREDWKYSSDEAIKQLYELRR